MATTPMTPAGEYMRSVSVSVAPRAGGKSREWVSDSLQPVAPGVASQLVSGLRIAFDVKRDAASEPSQGSVKLYNLSTSSRRWLQSDGLVVTVQAGYGGSLRTLFIADVADCYHEKQGTDWVTTLEGGDGEDAYRLSKMNYSGAPGVTRKEVFLRMADSMGLPLAFASDVRATAYQNGVTLVGYTRQFLDELTDELGLRWSVQNGSLQVMDRGGATTEAAFLIDADSGLVGRVALRRGDDGLAGLKFSVRMNGLLAPGRQVVVSDGDIAGTYVCEKVSHKGDSGYAPDYKTEVEAAEVTSG
jgi:hypothetical protein